MSTEKACRMGRPSCKEKAKYIDLDECNNFIKKNLGLCISFAVHFTKSRRWVGDQNIHESCALEAAFEAFLELKKIGEKALDNQKLVKCYLSKLVKQNVIHQYKYFGIIKNNNTIFFPKEWVSWEEYFKHYGCSSENSFIASDVLCAADVCNFSEIEYAVLRLMLQGNDRSEISKKVKISTITASNKMTRVTKVLKHFFSET